MPMSLGEKIAPWIQTLAGRAFDFEDVDDNIFDPEEVACVLSRLPRFTAHSKWRYSVAQHSVLVARRFSDPVLRLVGVLHDSPEAFINDISTPVKYWLRDHGTEAIDRLEDRIWCWVAFIHHFDPDLIDRVKTEDLSALATEARDLMMPPPKPWISLPEVWAGRIDVWSEEYSRDEWLRTYSEVAAVTSL